MDFIIIPFKVGSNIDMYSQSLEIIKKDESLSKKLIISSQPNGNNHFTELLHNSERKVGDPEKNEFKSMRTYWWEVPGRDQEWKDRMIKEIGGEEAFNKEFDLKFL